MKKVIRTLLPLLLCFALLVSVSAAPDSESKLLSGTLELYDGWLLLTIDLADNSSITNGQIQISFNPSEMELVRAVGSDLWDTQSMNPGTATLMFASSEAQAKGGKLLTVYFRPVSKAKSYTATANALLRKDLETVEEVSLVFTSEKVACDGQNCPSSAFKDLNVNEWYHTYTDYVIISGLMQGIDSNRFAPNAAVTRAMIVQTLYNMAGQPQVSSKSSFDDVPADAWYAKAIAWAQSAGIAKGVTGACFMPNEPVTRQQAAAFLYRYYLNCMGGTPVDSASLEGYKDVDQIDAYAVDAMTWANAAGIITGMRANRLDPKGETLRCQLAKMLTVMDQIG